MRTLNSIHQISSAARFLKCTFSACGNYVFVGSTNGQVHFWRSDSGAYLGSYSLESLPSWGQGSNPIVDISFHPLDHLIAFSSWGAKEPLSVYTWDKRAREIRVREDHKLSEFKITPTGSLIKGLNVEEIVSTSMQNVSAKKPEMAKYWSNLDI
jgi:WD40 repeat protein